jgi:hypothetical protein
METIIVKENIEELLKYEKKVKSLAITKSEMLYFNSGADHASIVMESIFNTSNNLIKIFAGDFNDEVCQKTGDRYVKALKNYLLKGKKIMVLLNELENKEKYNLILDVLKQYSSSDKYKQNISVKLTTFKPQQDGLNVHFTLGDDLMYRLEYDTKNFLAEFSFNRKDKVASLTKIFDSVYQSNSQYFDLSTLKY